MPLFRRKSSPPYPLHKILLVAEGGPWTGEYVMVTGPAEDGHTYCKNNCRRSYPVAVLSGSDGETASFVQLGRHIHECGLEPAGTEYEENFKRRYKELKLFGTQNPLWHESEIA